MLDLPTSAYPFILAVIAAVAGRLLGGPVRVDAGSLPGWILYAVAAGCDVVGLAALWLSNRVQKVRAAPQLDLRALSCMECTPSP